MKCVSVMLSFRYLWVMKVEMSRRWMDMQVWSSNDR